MTEKQLKNRRVAYEADVLAHINMHKAKNQTSAVEAHMAVPAHKAIMEAGASDVDEPTQVELIQKMTKPQLIEFAELQTPPIDIDSSDLKADILEVILDELEDRTE